MSYYDASAIKDYIDVDVVEYEDDSYHVDYELYDYAAKYGIRFISDYEIKNVTLNGVDIKKSNISAYARNCIELEIERKHRPGISGI